MAAIHISVHYPGIRYYSWSTVLRAAKGNFLDDLSPDRPDQSDHLKLLPASTSSRCYSTDPRILVGVGQWPKTKAIKIITRIVVYGGDDY